MTGRQLFELTHGATLMLNPNGTSCTLYSEEIAALLDRGDVAIIDQVQLTEIMFSYRKIRRSISTLMIVM